MPGDHEVTHGDILRAIGTIEGKLDAMHSNLGQKHTDIAEAFRRLGEAEKRIAQGMIIAVSVGVIFPLVWQAMGTQVHFGRPPAEVRQ
jgi:hypothetical protein